MDPTWALGVEKDFPQANNNWKTVQTKKANSTTTKTRDGNTSPTPKHKEKTRKAEL
jgi:hypothetical protein